MVETSSEYKYSLDISDVEKVVDTAIAIEEAHEAIEAMEDAISEAEDAISEAEDAIEAGILLDKSHSSDVKPTSKGMQGLKKANDWRKAWSGWIFCICVTAYTIAACILSNNRNAFSESYPILVFCIALILRRIAVTFREPIKNMCRPMWKICYKPFDKHDPSKKKYRMIFLYSMFGAYMLFFILYMTFAIVQKYNEPMRYVGFAGLCVLYGLGFIFSKHKKHIRARPICASLMIQISVGLVVMNTSFGFDIIDWLSGLANTFLFFVYDGASFVFGVDKVIINPEFTSILDAEGAPAWAIKPPYNSDASIISNPTTTDVTRLHYFALVVLPTVIYIGAITSVLYYLQVIQPFIKGVGWLLGGVLGTTTPESTVAAASTFLGLTEAPLTIRPFVGTLSISEIHTVATTGLGTVAGSTLGAYIGVGVPAGQLISSIVMSSVGSLGMAKLLWPETDQKKLEKGEINKKELRDTLYADMGYVNVVEACAAGTSDAVMLSINIAAMLISFLSIIALMNSFLNWICFMVDIIGPVTEVYPNGSPITIEFLMSYLFAPIAYVMGVTEWREALLVGQLLGIKIIATELTAFTYLGDYIDNNKLCASASPGCVMSDVMSDQAVTIATYSLCGFGNFGSIGILIGGLTPIAPHQRHNITRAVGRALIAGLLTNLVVATIAGMVSDPALSFYS